MVFGGLIPQLNPGLYASRGLLLCFRKGLLLLCLLHLNLIKEQGEGRGGRREKHKFALFCISLCAGLIDTVNPQHTVRRGKLSLSKAKKLPADPHSVWST